MNGKSTIALQCFEMCSNQAQAYFNNIPFRFDLCSFEFLFHVMQLRKCFVSFYTINCLPVHSCIFRNIIENLIPFFSSVLFCHPTNISLNEEFIFGWAKFHGNTIITLHFMVCKRRSALNARACHSTTFLPVSISSGANKIPFYYFFVKTNQFLILCIFPDS